MIEATELGATVTETVQEEPGSLQPCIDHRRKYTHVQLSSHTVDEMIWSKKRGRGMVESRGAAIGAAAAAAECREGLQRQLRQPEDFHNRARIAS